MTVEEPLAGGYGNEGAVVRVGDTIRRPARQSSTAVRALLLHLEDCGFDGAPRFLDIDDQWLAEHRDALIRSVTGR